MPGPMDNLAVMLSGSGTGFADLHRRCSEGLLRARVVLVIASRECQGAERARGLGIPTIVRAGVIPHSELERMLEDHWAGAVALAGYLKLVEVPSSYRWRMTNIHPALLPSFGGVGMYGLRVHRAVLEAGCRVSGCTVHFVDEAYDRGPIIAQRAVEVRQGDTPEMLQARVQGVEREVYAEALGWLISGRLRVEGRRVEVMGAVDGGESRGSGT